jgi:hypothetical protein
MFAEGHLAMSSDINVVPVHIAFFVQNASEHLTQETPAFF